MQKIIVKEKVSKNGNPYTALVVEDENRKETVISFEASKIFRLLPQGVGYKDITKDGVIIGELYE